MGRSYGTITIVDNTDLGQLSVYLTGSTVRQQAYNGNSTPPTYYPNWNTQTTGGVALVITPHVFYNGASITNDNQQLSVRWSKVEDGITYSSLPVSPTTGACPESLGGLGSKSLNRPTNLNENGTGVIYRADIEYRPIVGDNSVVIRGAATLDFTITKYGLNGASGTPAKMLQLSSTGSHFTYRYTGDLFGNSSITLTAQKSTTVAGIHWYCDNNLVYSSSGSPTITPGTNTAYTEDSLIIAGNSSISGTVDINSLSSGFSSNKVAQFKVVEIDSNGTEVSNGILDYFSIYAYYEAQPGDSVYTAFLDNDEETVSVFNDVPDLTGAISTFYINKNGVSDIANWSIAITDSNTSGTNNITYTTSAAPGGYNNTNNRITVTGLTANTAWIQFTATHKNYGVSGTDEENLAPITQRFTITKNPSLVSHSLRLDSVVANRDSNSGGNNIYTPSTIEVDAITRTGGGTNPYRTQGVIKAKIYYVNDTTESKAARQYITNSANSVLNITLQDDSTYGPIEYIEVFLGTSPNWDDKQKIVVTNDGINGREGVDSWSVNLTNSFDAISTTYDYKVTQDFDIKIPFEVMEGITEKDVYYYSGSGENYPQITATAFSYTDSTSIAPSYYLDNTQKTNGNIVNNVRFSLLSTGANASKSIGSNGTITLIFNLDSTHTVTKIYNYKAQPEALDAVNVQLYADPSDTFENQSGERIIRPIITSGVTDLAEQVTKYTWWVYDGTWKTLTNNSSNTNPEKKYITGIITGQETGTAPSIVFTPVENGSSTSKLLKVSGSAVDGYISLRLDATVAAGGVTKDYTEYIALRDISDPIQVSVLSTIGTQIVNGQGVGVIHARVTRDNIEIDPIVSDGLLGVGTDAPSGSINTGIFQGKTGYVYLNNSNGAITYYSRDNTSANWAPRQNTQATYNWSFRDKDNVPITGNTYSDWANLHQHLQYIITNSANTQFIYVDKDVINHKLTADVQVTLG